MIRKATQKDIDRIMDIIERSVAIMRSSGNIQWNSEYPARGDILHDISEKTLYVYEDDISILGFICINQIQPDEYLDIEWNAEPPFYALHRMAVDPDLRGKGIGGALMNFAEEHAAKNGVNYIRSDTFSKNTNMNRLFESCGYRKTGEVHFRGITEHFNCYDKAL